MRLAGRPLAIAATLALVAFPTLAQTPSALAVAPDEPPRGARVGPRPIFIVSYETLDEEVAPRDLRFRITLSGYDGTRGEHDFDQRRDPTGWLSGEPDRMIYRPGRPIPDGSYRWRTWIWDGHEWDSGAERRELHVDSVPPADVEGLVVEFDGGGEVRLDWLPVTVDRNGASEYVARYHVYRYAGGAIFPQTVVHEIGEVEQPGFVDPAPPLSLLLFYRVTAEDEAGNEAGRRD